MGETLIRVEGVSKKFCRSLKRSLWYGMQDLGNEVLGRCHGGTGELRTGEFWAVKDVSFELKRGECLGLIGHNGAGKTTLLRMLNGLIKPDRGRIEMRGRVGALIALGAGFNPILTGRENIYVNASVLGLRKRAIDQKIDEIIDFAEIGEFIDAPVQSYSSGMQVRLGFAIATSIEPDVILLDEVLAVGDASFRAKCYQRISSLLSKSAVILVSHNIDQVGQLCTTSIVMSSGHNIYAGNVSEGIKFYNDSNINEKISSEVCEYCSPGFEVLLTSGTDKVIYGGNLIFKIQLKTTREILTADIKLTIFTSLGEVVAESYTKQMNKSDYINEGIALITIEAGPFFLRESTYRASVVVLDRNNNEHIYWGSRIFVFHASGPPLGTGSYVVPMNIIVKNQMLEH